MDCEKRDQENILIAESKLFQKIGHIEKQNLWLYTFCKERGNEVITNIITKNHGHITSKEQLLSHFEIVRSSIMKFERCEYCRVDCKRNNCDCQPIECEAELPYRNPSKESYSYDSFNKVARTLFYVSYEYKDFNKDLQELYEKEIIRLRNEESSFGRKKS
jgi:hypothetical protein